MAISGTRAEPGRGTEANLSLYLLNTNEHNSQPSQQEVFLK